jgi:flagellar biosynthesis/type III secretory pathway chaperone
MAATLMELEQRVRALETRQGRTDEDVTALIGTVDEIHEDTQALRAEAAEHGQVLREHGELLRQILQRLPQ